MPTAGFAFSGRPVSSNVMRRNCTLRLGAATLALVQTTILAASFDCSKAASPTERMICADKELSELDGVLGDTFSLELDREDAVVSLRETLNN